MRHPLASRCSLLGTVKKGEITCIRYHWSLRALLSGISFYHFPVLHHTQYWTSKLCCVSSILLRFSSVSFKISLHKSVFRASSEKKCFGNTGGKWQIKKKKINTDVFLGYSGVFNSEKKLPCITLSYSWCTSVNIDIYSQSIFTCPKSTMETPDQCVNSARN